MRATEHFSGSSSFSFDGMLSSTKLRASSDSSKYIQSLVQHIFLKDDSCGKCLGLHELQVLSSGTREKPLALADDQRVYIQMEFIDETILNECRDENTTAIDENIFPRHILEFADSAHDIAVDDGRISPHVS